MLLRFIAKYISFKTNVSIIGDNIVSTGNPESYIVREKRRHFVSDFYFTSLFLSLSRLELTCIIKERERNSNTRPCDQTSVRDLRSSSKGQLY